MNKKFSTLVASLLLAGSLFNANAYEAEWKTLSAASGTGYYYVLKINGGVTTAAKDVSYNSWSIAAGSIVENGSTVSAANSWKITAVKINGSVIGYQFTNAEGKKMQFDAGGKWVSKNGVYDTFTQKDGYIWAVGTDGDIIADKCLKQIEDASKTDSYVLTDSGTMVGIYTLPSYELTATELNNQLGDGFEFVIGKTKYNKDTKDRLVWNGAYDLEGDVFTGKVLTAGTDGSLTYKDENGVTKHIVLTKSTWSNLSNSLQSQNQEGFVFKAMTSAEMTENSKNILATSFTFTQPNAITAEPLEVKVTDTNDLEYELMVSHVDGKYYLTTGAANNLVNDDNQLVGEASFTYDVDAETGAKENTYVKFGADNYADMTVFAGGVWSITMDGDSRVKVAGNKNCEAAWVDASKVNTDYPEGQWIWNGSKFVNRESGAVLNLSTLRENDGVYTDAYGRTYTFTKEGETGNVFLGYYNEMTDDQLKQEAFYIGSPIKATGDTVYVAKADDGSLYLSAEVAEAVEFRLTRSVYTNDAGTKTSDLIQHITYANDNKTVLDVLNFYAYNLEEASTGESLSWDPVTDKFVLSEVDGYLSPFVIKNKGADVYNLVQGLKTDDLTNKDGKYLNEQTTTFCSTTKIYAGQNTAILTQADNVYETVANDLFVLKPVSAGQHVSGIYGQNIKLFRDADNSYVLYEEGKLLETKDEVLEGFLGMQNILDPKYSEVNAAMYVDSAAGLNTWRPEYMLVLEPNVVPAGKVCPIHGVDCKDGHLEETAGYVEGRYLVNLVDSAKAATKAGVKDADNKFMYQKYATYRNKYYRLGFVAAKHIGDSLIIASTNDTIDLATNNHNYMNVCDFAFHYTDASRSAFVIETAYEPKYATAYDVEEGDASYVGELMSSKHGYVKYHNGVPVVTKNESEAEVFNLAQTEEEATANEAIAASAVTVIAGEGNVTIAGAAGKKVVIANILGQTIANTVLTSDNATIAAPAGVVVVAVEGEAAVKAIVK